MKVVIDTNLWVSFAIGKQLSDMLVLLPHPEMQAYVCDELLEEFIRVTSKPKIRKYLTDDNVRNAYALMKRRCRHVSITKNAVSPIRDKKDLYLLSLAETVSADFILSGDKDLLSLQSHGQTRILTYREFTAQLGM